MMSNGRESDLDSARAFDALMAEADWLNKGIVSVIENTRRLVLSAIYIAGAGVPVMASFVAKENVSLSDVIVDKGILLQFICAGEVVVCVALLHVYEGNFLQIFANAEYVRNFLRPSMAKSPVPLFYWESWLRERRVSNRSGAIRWADIRLLAEPLIIIFFISIYCALLLVISYFSRAFFLSMAVSTIFFLAMLSLAIRSIVSIYRTALK